MPPKSRNSTLVAFEAEASRKVDPDSVAPFEGNEHARGRGRVRVPNTWNTPTAAYQSVAVLKVARASWAPDALAAMSSMSAEPELVWARRVNCWACEEPGVTVPGDPPVMMPPITSSPAPTGAVGPESTAVPVPLAAATWSRAPAVATPLYSDTAPWRYVGLVAVMVIVRPHGAAAEFCT